MGTMSSIAPLAPAVVASMDAVCADRVPFSRAAVEYTTAPTSRTTAMPIHCPRFIRRSSVSILGAVISSEASRDSSSASGSAPTGASNSLR